MPNLGELIVGLNVDTSQLDKTVAKMTLFKKLMLQQVAELNMGMKTIAGSVQTIQENMGKAAISTTAIEKTGVSSLQKFDKHLRMTAMSLQRFGYLATTVLTVPMIAFGKSTITAYKDFEFSMAKIVGLVGIAKEEVKEWGKEILSIAPKLGKSPQELADALYFVSSAGFKSAEALTITEASAKAAAAGLGETKDVANIVTSVMNAYRKSNISATQSLNILVAAVREGKGEPAEFAKSIGSVIPFAAQLGVSFDQVAGAMAAMTLTGSSAANAATYLRNIFMKMIHPAAQSEKALRLMGSSTAELRDILRDTKNGGLIPMLERVKNLTGEFGEQRLGEIFPNIRGLIGVLSLMGQNLEYNKRVMDLVKNSAGDLQKAFNAVTDTVQFKLNKASASMKVSFIEFGKVVSSIIVPAIEWLSAAFKKFVEHINEMSPAMKRFTVGALAFAAALGPLSLITSLFLQGVRGIISILGTLVSNIGPAITIIGTLGKAFMNVSKIIIARTAIILSGVSSMLGGIITFFTSLIAKTIGAGSAFGTFLKWMKVGPLLAVVAAIGAVIAVISLLKKHTNELTEAQKSATKYMGEEFFALNHIVDRAKAAAEGSNERKDAIRSLNNMYGKYLSNLVDEKTFLNDITRAQKEATNAIIANASIKGYQEQITNVVGDIAKAYDKGLGGIQDKFAKVFKGDQLVDFINDMYKSADDASKHYMEKFGTGDNADWLSHMFMKSMYSKYIVPMNKGLKEGAVSIQEFSDAWYTFWNVKREKSPILNNLQTVVDAYQNVLNIAEKAKGLKSPIPGFEIGKEPEEMLKVWADMEDKLYILQLIEDEYKAHGVALDKNQEKLSIYKEAFEALATVIDPSDKRAATAMSFLADKIKAVTAAVENTKKSGKEYDKFVNDVTKDTNKFALGLELIATKVKLEGSSFNANAAYVQLYEQRVADLYEVLANLNTFKFVPVIGMTYSVVEASLKDAMKALENYRQKMNEGESDANLRLLQMEADAFGNMAGKVEVANFQVQALERQLRTMLTLKVTNILPISDEQIKEKVKQIQEAKTTLLSWQNEMDLSFLKDMNNALQTTATRMDLASGAGDAMKKTLQEMSALGLGTTEQFKQLAAQYQEFTVAQEIASQLGSAFTDLFGAIIDGAESMGKTLEGILKNIAKQLMAFVVKKIIVQAYLEPFVEKIVGSIKAAREMQQSMKVMGLVQKFVLPFIGLKKGGVIPEGYPDDSFPAMLSSGEMVVPKKKVEAAERAGHTYKEYFDMPIVRSKPEIAKLQKGGVIPQGYPNDTFPALLSSGEAVIPLSKGGDSTLVTLMKQLIIVTEKGNGSILDSLVGVGGTVKTDPLLTGMKEYGDNLYKARTEWSNSMNVFYNHVNKLNTISGIVKDPSYFKIKDVEGGKPGIRNGAIISKQIVADMAAAAAKEQVPLMTALETAMRETGIGSFAESSTWYPDKPTYDPNAIMSGWSANTSDVKGMPRGYEQFLMKKGYAPKEAVRRSNQGMGLDIDWIIKKPAEYLDKISAYSDYIKNFKIDETLLEPFRKEMRFLNQRSGQAYNPLEKERPERLAKDRDVIMRNPELYNYADSVYKANQPKSLAYDKQMPMMTGITNLWTKLFKQKETKPEGPSPVQKYTGPNYTGMGLGFMQTPKYQGTKIGKQGFSQPIPMKLRMDELVNSPEFQERVSSLVMGSIGDLTKIGSVKAIKIAIPKPMKSTILRPEQSALHGYLGPTPAEAKLRAHASIKDITHKEGWAITPTIAKRRTQAVDEGTNWLQNWLTSPPTLKKIKKLPGPYAEPEKIYKSIAKQQYKAHIPDFRTILDPFDQFGMDIGSIGGLSGKEVTTLGTRMKNQTNSIQNLVSPRMPNKAAKSIAIHEGTHGLFGAQAELIPFTVKKMLRNALLTKNDFLSGVGKTKSFLGQEMGGIQYHRQPTEIYARLMELRSIEGLKPGQKVSEKMTAGFLEKGIKKTGPYAKEFGMDPLFFNLIKGKKKLAELFNILPNEIVNKPKFNPVQNEIGLKAQNIPWRAKIEKQKIYDQVFPNYTNKVLSTPNNSSITPNVKNITESWNFDTANLVARKMQEVEKANAWQEDWWNNWKTKKKIGTRTWQSGNAKKWYERINEQQYKARIPTKEELWNPDEFQKWGGQSSGGPFGITKNKRFNYTLKEYNRQNLVNPKIPIYSVESTAIHEGTHGVTDANKLIGPRTQGMMKSAFYTPSEAKDVFGKLPRVDRAQLKYYRKATEIYARIMELRKAEDIVPGQVLSTKRVSKMIESGKQGAYSISKDFFKYIKDPAQFRKTMNKLPAIGGVGLGLGLASQTVQGQEVPGKKKTYKDLYLQNDSVNQQVSNLLNQRMIGSPWQQGKTSPLIINNRALEEQAMKMFKDYYGRELSKLDMSKLQLGRMSWTGNIPKTPALPGAEDITQIPTSLTNVAKGFDDATRKATTFNKMLEASNMLLMSSQDVKKQGILKTANQALDMSLDVTNKTDPEGAKTAISIADRMGSYLSQMLAMTLTNNIGNNTGGQKKNPIAQMLVSGILGSMLNMILPGVGGILGGLLGGNKNKVGSFLGKNGSLLPNFATGRFAGGGIVPSGFPNDTYPAWLSSGEIIIPKMNTPKFAADTFDQAPFKGEVRFEIEDNRLVGILNKYNIKKARY